MSDLTTLESFDAEAQVQKAYEFTNLAAGMAPMQAENPGLWEQTIDGLREAFDYSPAGLRKKGEKAKAEITENVQPSPTKLTGEDFSNFYAGYTSGGAGILPPGEGDAESSAFKWGSGMASMLGGEARKGVEALLAKSRAGEKITDEEAGRFGTELVAMLPMGGVGLTTRMAGMVEQRTAKEAAELKGLAEAIGFSDKPLMEIAPVIDAGAAKVLAETGERVATETVGSASTLRVPIGDRAGNVNLSRIETPDDVKAVITSVADAFKGNIDEARRGVQTNLETAALADTLGMTPQKLMSRRRGQAFSAEEAYAARNLLVSSADNLTGLAKKASGPMASEADVFAFRKAMSTHYAIQTQVQAMTAEAGRALQSFRMMAGGTEGQARAIRELLDRSGGVDMSQAMAGMIATLDSPAAINSFVQQAQRATTMDVLSFIWINGLLSNPVTHAANLTGNTLTALTSLPERLLASGFRGVAKGSGSDVAGVEAGEAFQAAYGLIEGFKDGLKAAGKVARTGEAFDVLGKIESRKIPVSAEGLGLSGTAGQAADVAGKVIGLPGRGLEAGDALFKTVGYRMELRAQALRQATAEGLEGAARDVRIAEILNDPPEALHLAAVDASRYQTFTNQLGETGRRFTQFANSHPALRFVVPFIRTPANILKYTFERTPLAPLMSNVRSQIAAGGAQRDLALARISLGSMLMATAGVYAQAGLINGAGPSDAGMNEAWRMAGNQPYSVKVGDTWYSFSRMEPIGSLMGMAADVVDIARYADDDMDVTEAAAAGALSMVRNVTSKTFLTGIADLFEVLDRRTPVEGLEKYITRQIGSWVPAGVASLERAIDPTMNVVSGPLEQIRSRIPGLSSSLPPRRNLFGEPVVLQGAMGPDILSPIYVAAANGDKGAAEILRLEMSLDKPRKTLNFGGGQVELDSWQYDRLAELAGNGAKDENTGLGFGDTVRALATGAHPQSTVYAQQTDGPDGGKAMLIKQYQRTYLEMAKSLLIKEYPEVEDALKASIAEKGLRLGAAQ